jgi:hypothetical protein
MKPLSPQKRSELLSQYLDGTLTPEERQTVDDLLATDPSAQKEYHQLQRLKSLMGTVGRLEPDIGLWTRLSIRIDDIASEEQNLLPFPKRYLLHVASVMTLVIAVIGTTAIMNRTSIVSFFGKQSQAVKQVYEQGLLKGSVLPLFARVDKDKALQFSLFGELSLDDRSKTALRVDESAEQGYRIEVGKKATRKTNPVTFERFVQEVKPTPVQRRVIDSLLNLAQDRLASAILVGEGNALAVDPDLPRLNRIMLTGIASCLEPNQRRDFERLLAVHDAPYAVSIARSAPAMPSAEVFSRLQVPHAGRFLVITPDTAIMEGLRIDLDSMRRFMEFDLRRMEDTRRIFLERMGAVQYGRQPRVHISGEQFPPVGNDSVDEFIRVNVGPSLDELPDEMRVMVSPRLKSRTGVTRGEVRIRVFGTVPAPGAGVAPKPPHVVVEVDSGR